MKRLLLVTGEDAILCRLILTLQFGGQGWVTKKNSTISGGPYSATDLYAHIWDPVTTFLDPFYLHYGEEWYQTENLRVTEVPPFHPPIEWSHNDVEDAARFATFLNRIGTSFGLLSRDHSNDRRFENEKNVIHHTMSGVLLPPGTVSYITNQYDYAFECGDCQVDVVLSPWSTDGNGKLDNNPVYQTYSVSVIDYFTAFKSWVEETSGPHQHFELAGGIWILDRTVYNVSIIEDPSFGLMIRYKVKERYYASSSPEENYDEAVFTTVLSYNPPKAPVEYHEPSRLIYTRRGPLGTDAYNEFDWQSGFFTVRTVISDVQSAGSIYPREHFVAGVFEYTQPSWPIPVSRITSDVQVPEDISLLTSYASGLGNWVHQNLPDIWHSAYVPSAQSVADSRSFIEANYLESLSEIGELLELFPNVKPLNDFLSFLPQGKLVAGTLRLVDFVSDFYLLYKFGLETTKADVFEFASKYDQIAAKLRKKLQQNLSLRGKFLYVFPSGSPMDGFTLLTRSKVVISFPTESISAALLPAESMGLLPSPSNLWDLVPFSFAIDWFVNLGTRMELGEAYTHACFATVYYCVHSYSLQRTLTSSELPGPFKDWTPHNAVFETYVRVKSKYIPGPGQSRYDWLAKTAGPPKWIAGALLWSFLRH